MKKNFIFSLLVLLVATTSAFAEKYPPMQVRTSVDIPDGEYLIYGDYVGGVKSADFHMVTTYIDQNTVKAYLQMQKVNSSVPLPADYHNWAIQVVVNLKTASIVSYVDNNENYVVKQNKEKGVFYTEINYGKEINAIQKTWDGYEIHEKKLRVRNVDVRYPIWTSTAFLIWGGRLLDWEASNGILNIWEPMFKDPVPGTLFKLKNESVKTALGTFETDKVGWKISDPFLGALIKQVTDSITMNVEKTTKKRAIMIDVQASGEKWFLEKESNVLKK